MITEAAIEKPEKKKSGAKKPADNSTTSKQQAMNDFLKKMHGGQETDKELAKQDKKPATKKEATKS